MNVLIVDDIAAIRKILRHRLQQIGLPLDQVHEAADGVEALTCLNSNDVQLILSDINMPVMDGLQLLRQLKNNPKWNDIPVIMVTTEGAQGKVMEAIGLGAAGYIRKPFTAGQMREKFETAGIIKASL